MQTRLANSQQVPFLPSTNPNSEQFFDEILALRTALGSLLCTWASRYTIVGDERYQTLQLSGLSVSYTNSPLEISHKTMENSGYRVPWQGNEIIAYSQEMDCDPTKKTKLAVMGTLKLFSNDSQKKKP